MGHRVDEICGHSIMKRHVLKISSAMLVVVLSGCAKAAIPLDTTYAVRKLELVGERAVGPAFWLDNQRLLFSKIILNATLGTPRELAVWDTLTGRIEPAPSGIPADINCYDPETGYLRYFANRKDYMGGLPGKLRPIPRPEETGVIDVVCRSPLEGDLPGDLRERNIKFLWRLAGNDGYLWPRVSTGSAPRRIPMALYDVTGHKIANMPFGTIESQAIRYAPFKGAYLVEREQLREGYNGTEWYDIPTPLIVDDQHIGWWLYPDGKVEKAIIPPRTQIKPNLAGGQQSMMYYPTARGIIFEFNTLDSLSGAYLAVDEKRLVKVADGAATGGFSISPDGCKVAFPLSPKLGAMESDLVIVDLCRAVSQ